MKPLRLSTGALLFLREYEAGILLTSAKLCAILNKHFEVQNIQRISLYQKERKPGMEQETIGRFLVDIFNHLLRQEQQALASSSYSNLSVNEFHVIEAVVKAGVNNTMGALSQVLGITIGSLTVAVKTLEQKGYLLRKRETTDRRIVHVEPTPLGLEANTCHAQFHEKMTEAIVSGLDQQELQVLSHALATVEDFFLAQANSNSLCSKGV